MDLDEKNPACYVNQLVSRFEEELRVCKEALLEAKKRVIVLEQRLRVFLTCLIVLISGTMFYAVIQIWQTSNFLQNFTRYVQQERDPRWETWFKQIRDNQQTIQSYVEKTQVK